MSDEKSVELETKIAFLEQHIGELSDVVYAQQKTLDTLTQNLNHIAGKLRDANSEAQPMADEKPPHY